MFVGCNVSSNKPYLIIGQGLAGTILAHQCFLHSIPCHIWDSPKTHVNSSQAAGGIYNPVTGRKLEKTWLATELFTYLADFYPRLEQILQTRFFYPMPLFRPFANHEMKHWLIERKDAIHHDFLEWTETGVWVKQAGWVDVVKLLAASRSYFESLGMYSERVYEPSDNFEATLFCEGFHGQENPYWKDLSFLPAKGESLVFSSPDPSPDFILNKNGFMLPLQDGNFKVGATYRWDEFGSDPTDAAHEELLGKLASMGVESYSILETRVGIRPATQDRRPFIGLHPNHPVGIFNGFGSKGVSLIPYFSDQFAKSLQGVSSVDEAVAIHRFSHLFSV